MTQQLTRFQVIGLHGSLTMDVPLANNRLVLVGENGSGKSTFVNLLYYFLTRQWSKLHAFTFERVHAHFGDEELVLTHEHINQFAAQRREYMAETRNLPPSLRRELLNQGLLFWHDAESDDVVLIERFAHEHQMSMRRATEVVRSIDAKRTRGKPTHLETIQARISELVQGQFLYLPTYRRIEQDLRSIFQGVEIEVELRKFRDRLGRRKGRPYIELVEFGMEDVEQTIANRMTQGRCPRIR
jgi:energy-coupling factor transporter ATP-binding protein EcfA2